MDGYRLVVSSYVYLLLMELGYSITVWLPERFVGSDRCTYIIDVEGMQVEPAAYKEGGG